MDSQWGQEYMISFFITPTTSLCTSPESIDSRRVFSKLTCVLQYGHKAMGCSFSEFVDSIIYTISSEKGSLGNLLAFYCIFQGEERKEMTPELALSPRLEFGDNAVMSHPREEAPVQIFGSREEELGHLIVRSRAGDAAAMEEIYRRFKTGLFNLAFRYSYDRASAEDLLQEIFIKVFTHLDDVKNTETFAGWVYRIGLNTCYSHLRSHRTEMEKGVPMESIEGTTHGAVAVNPAEDARKSLDEGIAVLPGRLREIFLLHDVQGFKHEEIARMLGLSVGTSKSQLFKARLRLRSYLIERGVC